MTRIEEIIKHLDLLPHPEGGYYKETYRSVGNINADSLAGNYKGKRSYSTSIYFLLTSTEFSAFHKIKQDEIWHFHEGSPIRLHTISEEGNHQEYCIGTNFLEDQKPQLIVPGNHWFAASVIETNSYALVSCTVSPGFDFSDFVLPSREYLVSKYPQHKQLIHQYTLK